MVLKRKLFAFTQLFDGFRYYTILVLILFLIVPTNAIYGNATIIFVNNGVLVINRHYSIVASIIIINNSNFEEFD